MADNLNPLHGKGPRPSDPYVRILWAAKRGQGVTLSREEVWDMHLDAMIENRAAYVVTRATPDEDPT